MQRLVVRPPTRRWWPIPLEEFHAKKRNEEHCSNKHHGVEGEHKPIQGDCGVSTGEGTSSEYTDEDCVKRDQLVGGVPGNPSEEVTVPAMDPMREHARRDDEVHSGHQRAQPCCSNRQNPRDQVQCEPDPGNCCDGKVTHWQFVISCMRVIGSFTWPPEP